MATKSDIDELVAAYLEALDGGDPAALAELRGRHPELELELDQRLFALAQAGFLERDESAPEPFPETLGEFRLLQRLGEGGMGVVFLAEQPSLGRRVAIKLVRPDQLYFRGARERFRREVEAVAQMAHPSIVPVYSVGEERGIPYFVMEHVPGVGIDELVAHYARGAPPRSGELFEAVEALARGRGWSARGRPAAAPFDLSWSDACIWMAREMAQALEHAHQRGVLHRDVKPSNAMLTPDGRIQLMDFGLASSAGSARLTRSGSQAGSLAYMAPEQLRGGAQAIDARTDVYALGVTLYELLSLQLPYAPTTAVELHEDIRSGRSRPLRKLADWVSRDAQTVVARAMAVRPEDRYPSAADLARDLTNLLERRPIEARPAGPWTQLARWSQRNRAAAALLAVVLLVAIGAPLLFGLQQQRLSAREERQRLRAEANLADAFGAVREMLAKVGKNQLENVPGAEELRLEFLTTAVTFCDGLIERNPDDVELRALRASLGEPISKVLLAIGRSQEVQSILVEHLEELRSLRASGLMQTDVLRELAVAVNALGVLQKDTQRPEQAEVSFHEALAYQREAIALEPGYAKAYANLALMEGNLALMAYTRGDLEACAQGYARALVASQEGYELDPDDFDVAVAHASTLSMAALVDSRRSGSGAATQRFEQARVLQERLMDSYPDDANLTYAYVRTCVNYSAQLGRAQDCVRGSAILAGALERARTLHADFPAQLEYQNAFGTCLAALGELRTTCGDPEAAIELQAEACDVLDDLARRPGTNPEQRMHASQVRAALGRALLEAGRLDEAAEVLELALTQCRSDWQAEPKLGTTRLSLGMVRLDLVRLDLRTGGTAGVAEELEDLGPLLAHDPEGMVALAGAWIDLAAQLASDEAAASSARARAIESLLAAQTLGFERVREIADSAPWATARQDPGLAAALGLSP